MDFIGGGLLRSTGGWAAVKDMRKSKIHLKSDERILGDGNFVSEILALANEDFERKYALKAKGVDIHLLAEKVAGYMKMPVEDVWLEGRYQHLVKARSLICFGAVRGLGISMASLAKQFNISSAAVSKSVVRGAEIIKNEGLHIDKLIS